MPGNSTLEVKEENSELGLILQKHIYHLGNDELVTPNTHKFIVYQVCFLTRMFGDLPFPEMQFGRNNHYYQFTFSHDE